MASDMNIENLGAFGLVIGAIGIIYGIWKHKKMNDLAKKLETTVEELEKKTTVDIQDEIVNKAIQNTVDREVKKNVDASIKKIDAKYEKVMEDGVNAEVKRNLATIKEDVAKTIAKQVSDIDEDALSKTVQEKGAEMILNKHEHKLDEALEKFNEKIDKKLEKFDDKLESITDDCEEKANEVEKKCKNSLDTIMNLYNGVADVISPWNRKINGSGLNFRVGD